MSGGWCSGFHFVVEVARPCERARERVEWDVQKILHAMREERSGVRRDVHESANPRWQDRRTKLGCSGLKACEGAREGYVSLCCNFSRTSLRHFYNLDG